MTNPMPAAEVEITAELVRRLLRAASHEAFRAAYAAGRNGAISAGTWARGRGWALNLAIVFLAWTADNPQLHEVGERTLAADLSPAP
jgi:hypothetical protein